MADDYIRVADASDLPPGELMRAEAHGYEICLANVGGEVVAVSNECPHASWPLDIGFLDGEQIVCSGHSIAFNIRHYVKASPYDPGITTYPVKVEDGGIWVASS